jgi:hypothetical protein
MIILVRYSSLWGTTRFQGTTYHLPTCQPTYWVPSSIDLLIYLIDITYILIYLPTKFVNPTYLTT